MRCAIDLDSYLVKTAELYAPGRKGADAVSWLLDDYPRLVKEIRDLRRRVSQLDQEGAELDSILEELRQIANRINQL
ncbi:DASH complex subunit Dad3 [Stutzerimonas decontaminans]|uniref:DASH complex subunit Dad3 n=1 Tax=Stutzerimonas decontaminans TaxID=3022791 RepID=A0ABX4VUH3_9GAMM|nr:DASH complex subunit Dad3 [Stutzerimonas decontaminans]PNF82805.1 DASH complex subunit Dad3 [Stutzerimonas decontaminans]PNF82808.1 DASH complex subunit Dad3 [Stutzerimonas decontaminans]